ncbi:MAG: redoxin domain-containing protein [Pirellulaceae bacterium]
MYRTRITRNIFLLIACLVAANSASGAEPAEGTAEPVPATSGLLHAVSTFQSQTLQGDSFELTTKSEFQATVVCFLGTECPLAKLYGPRLQALANQFQQDHVRFVGVFSNVHDSVEEISEFAQQHQIAFPILKDSGNHIADLFSAERTPEVFLVDETLAVRYRGRIDDQYQPGIVRPEAKHTDLRNAIMQLLANEPISVPETKAVGCIIGREVASAAEQDVEQTVTFCGEIADVLNRNCVECHRSGEIGPFALIDYDEVVGWGEMMLEVIQDGRMPPWHADPEFGHFQNERIMSDKDKDLLKQWVAAGMPFGDKSKLPPTPDFHVGWRLPGEPDAVFAMRNEPFVVPADGTVEYQYFVVDPGFTEDKWVTAAEVVPGNAAVVHHSIVFIRPPDGSQFRGIGWLTAYVPGQGMTEFGKGRARKIPAGSKLVFQQHYTPIGREQTDCTKIGLVFGEPDSITHQVITLIGIDQEFEIPPQAENHDVAAAVRRLPARGELLAVAPHMHLRGKAFALFATKDEQTQTLLKVPHYDFNWQHSYAFQEPIPLSDLDRLHFVATFDNSANNPVNPDPGQHVTWGDQTWEEMAVAFFEVAEPRDGVPQEDVGPLAKPKKAEKSDSQVQAEVDQFVANFLKRFDQNQDGKVQHHETPLTIRRFAFFRWDTDGDEVLTKDEIAEAATSRFE